MSRFLKRLAVEVLGPEKAALTWGRMDVVGDILVIKSPSIAGGESLPIEDYRRLAEEVVRRIPYIKSVWLAVSETRGAERIRRLVHLAGEERTETIYKEHGCKFKVDVARVFVTPRLNYEHLRLARLVEEGERVVNMFAGAGISSIIIACEARPSVVHSIDINEYAYRYMVENIRLNKVEGVVIPHLGDAAQVIEERLVASADRVLMPLPALALEYLPYALKALEGRGWVHVYLHIPTPRGARPEEIAATRVSKRLAELGVSFEVRYARVVRPVGPRMYQVVVDVEVRGARR